MKYTKEERLQIGKEIYTHELNLSQAAKKYQINNYTARDYMRMYRDENNLGPMDDGNEELRILHKKKRNLYSDLNDMDKDQLITEVIKARVEAERAKKGYVIKGGGRAKEFVSLSETNTK